jgi:glutamate-ammonia-ligase adenylyltransferase
MRLRPFGDSGPLTASGAFLNDYLQTHGRDWERYAWVKARAITGTEAYQSIHAESVRPFVYRRYLDFGVFEALREMKALIQKEVARRDLADHVKLGPGGIREIEFIVQAFQLIRGGQDRRMQTPSLLAVLPQPRRRQAASARVAQELESFHVFLRRLENRLQMLGDNQVHTIRRRADARASRDRHGHLTGSPAVPSSTGTGDVSPTRSRKSYLRATRPRPPRCQSEWRRRRMDS